jgi:DNA-binding NtrC family response regulator
MNIKPPGPPRLELRVYGETMQGDATAEKYEERVSGTEGHELKDSTERSIIRSSYPNAILRNEDQSTNYKTTIALNLDVNPAQPLSVVEQRAILGALRESGGNKLAAARLLGIGRTTLYRRLKEYAEAGLWHEPKSR